MPPPKFYHDDEAWTDVEPLPQDDGGMHPLAAIAYTEEYSEAMGYLRAVMANNEFSERVLDLTGHIINMNPAHYTVWLYRAKTISELGKPLQDEIQWLNPTALKHLKNYQIWHHRQTIIDALGSPEGEADFVSKMLEKDEKNYHVWSYRQWLVKRFDLFDKPEEMQWTESMIEADVRNNSAWNHRYYLVIGRRDGNAPSADVTKHEIEYTKEAIRKAPQNQSPWNYLAGILRAAQLPKSTVKSFATEFADIQSPDDVYSSHALDLLADIYAEEENNKESAEKALDLLATRYDPIRANYWNYRKGLLSQPEVAAIFLKLENLQPSGSFKSRGIGNYILRRLEELPAGSQPHIFASSGGNAGLAAVHSARALNLNCTVVVPTATSALMVTKLRAAGAYDVISHGNAWKDADTYLREHVMPYYEGATIYCPPFDHPDIWTGNSSVMHEIAEQMPAGDAPDVIICSVGGGGLINGICQAMDSIGMTSPTILAVETAGADSLAASMSAKQVITLPKITSQATSLGCVRVTDTTYAYSQRGNVRSVVLPDGVAAMGCWRLADDERMMVELACGVNVALCYDGRLEKALGRPVKPDDKVVIVLCGGSNVTSGMLCEWRTEYQHIVDKELELERRDSAYTSAEASPKQGATVPSDLTVPAMPVIEGIEVCSVQVRT